ncbi:ATP-binding cassette domain-containing protein, partial [Glutamicibacter creatinolyticus]
MRASTTKRENPGAAPLIEVEQLAVRFGAQRAVDGVSFTLHAGQCLALVGESGSGKSVTARSLLGLSGGAVTADRLRVLGQDGLRLGENGWRTVRG